jgi:hypothetical protein
MDGPHEKDAHKSLGPVSAQHRSLEMHVVRFKENK